LGCCFEHGSAASTAGESDQGTVLGEWLEPSTLEKVLYNYFTDTLLFNLNQLATLHSTRCKPLVMSPASNICWVCNSYPLGLMLTG
jgi:hypothetical protein